MSIADVIHAAGCNCPGCLSGGDRGENFSLDFSLDPFAGGTFRDKPIWTLDQINPHFNRTGWNWQTTPGDTLTYGFWQTAAQVAAVYPVSDGFDESTAFTAFNAGQVALASNSIELWDDLIAIDIVRTSPAAANINFGNTSVSANVQAYAYLPFGNDFGPQYAGLAGDVWIGGSVASNFFPLTDGFYATTTMIHEIGHSLGLSHPGDYDAGDGVPLSYDLADYAQDSRQYSVMSYWEAYETNAQHINFNLLSFGYSSTPLVHDITAIQAIYGVDETTRTGDTTYGFNSTADRSAYDFELNISPIVTLYDAGGIDTLDLSGYDTDSFISLTPGSFSSAGGAAEFPTLEEANAARAAAGLPLRSQAAYDFYVNLAASLGLESYGFVDNISIAYNSIIENAVGGGGDDTLVANEVANVLDGGAGDGDVVSYQDAAAGVTVRLGTELEARAGAAALGDTYIGIEGVTGSAFADDLSGDARDNLLQGNGGNDIINGGEGSDTLNFRDAIAGVVASLRGAGVVAGDTLISIENILGSRYDDTLGGNEGANVISGGFGNDTVSYFDASGAVTVNLATGGSAGHATGDTYISIENVTGSNGNDTLTGDAGDNVITGGRGRDRLDGGDGIDTLSYADATTLVSVSLATNSASGGIASGDVISNFEDLIGSAFGDLLTGNAGVNYIEGGNGADRLNGQSGDDVLVGGDGNDSLRGDNNDDLLFGDAGADILLGGNNDDVLDGGEGADTLTGGSGLDTFLFSVIDGATDIITDFRTAIDNINLTLLDAISTTAAQDAFTFIGDAAFSAAGQLRTFSNGGVFSLGGDTNGDGVADLIIGLQGISTIAPNDLVLA